MGAHGSRFGRDLLRALSRSGGRASHHSSGRSRRARGQTFGAKEGGRISISRGQRNDDARAELDWMLTHEMVHLSFPSMADEHHWIEEGIATYVEPMRGVRARSIMDAHEI